MYMAAGAHETGLWDVATGRCHQVRALQWVGLAGRAESELVAIDEPQTKYDNLLATADESCRVLAWPGVHDRLTAAPGSVFSGMV